MKPGLYHARDDRKDAPVRCSALVQAWPSDDNSLIDVKNVDGALWLSLPMPDGDLIPGSSDDEATGTIYLPLPTGVVELRPFTLQDYNDFREEFDFLPPVSGEAEMVTALKSNFFTEFF